MQFSLIPLADGKFSFQVQDDEGAPILDSPQFFDRESCIASIRGFVDQMRNPDSVNILEENGNYAFELKDEAGVIWMKSLEFRQRDLLEDKLRALQSKATANTSFEVNMRRGRVKKIPRLPKEINMDELYDFSLRTRSKKLGFHPVEGNANKKHYFLFNDEAGAPILFSRSFSTPSQRDKRIRSVIKQSKNPRKYQILQNTGGAYFILKGSNGKEIARSGNFSDEAAAQKAIDLLLAKAPGFAKKYPEPAKTKKKRVNIYRLDQASTSGKTGFDPFKSEDGFHYFHFNDENGSPILFSEGYKTARSRDTGLKSLIKNAGLENRYEKKIEGDQHFFVLRAGNRQEIGRSKLFGTASSMDEIIRWLRIQIPRYAAAYGVSLDTDNLTESFNVQVDYEQEEDIPPVIVAPGGSDIGVIDDTPSHSDHASHTPAHTEVPTSQPSHTNLPSNGAQTASEVRISESSSSSGTDSIWRKAWPWLILLALILLLFLLFRACDSSSNVVPASDSLEENNKPVIAAESDNNSKTDDTLPEMDSSSMSAGPKVTEDGGNISSDDGGQTNISSDDPQHSSLAEVPASRLGFDAASMLGKMEAFLSGSGTGKSPVFAMDHARFPFNSPKLNKEAEKELDDLQSLLDAYPNAKLDIFGHIDLNEDDYYSGPFAEEFLTLSDIRARCIYRKLIERGISEDRLTFKGMANNQPIENMVNPKNRRLELVLIK